MRPFIRLMVIALLSSTLAACETAQVTEKEVVVTQQEISETALKQTYDQMMASTQNGSVRVFSLDAPAPDSVYVSAPTDSSMPLDAPVFPQPAGPGKAYGGDSNVMVFPVDPLPQGTYQRGTIPPMIPPSPLAPMPYEQGLSMAPAGQAGGSAKIYFDHGATAVSLVGQDVTAAVTGQCRVAGCALVKVEGHASTRAVAKDEIQRRLINLKVSMDRAMNVSRQLIRDGIPADAIQVTAHGDRVPPAILPGVDSEAAARRVEISTSSAAPLMY
ncbi:MAG: OmpA family protein [Alphaproteobacteria bacterium]|nr:OmpA family protein [Alphaproteobacteria bacterium]